MIAWMEGKLLLGIVLMVPYNNQKPNSQHLKVQQEDHFGIGKVVFLFKI